MRHSLPVILAASRSYLAAAFAAAAASRSATRAAFVAAFWELIDWRKVADRCIPKRYKCTACDYVYDPEKGDPETGIAPGTPFEEIPADWTCPLCGLYKDAFRAIEE